MIRTVAALALASVVVGGQAQAATPAKAKPAVAAKSAASSYRAPRRPDGKPDLNGVWQVMNTANWNIEPHAAQLGAAHAPGPGRAGARANVVPWAPSARSRPASASSKAARSPTSPKP